MWYAKYIGLLGENSVIGLKHLKLYNTFSKS